MKRILLTIMFILSALTSTLACAEQFAGYSTNDKKIQNEYCQNLSLQAEGKNTSATVGDIAFCMQDGLLDMPDLMDMIAYLCGLFLGVKSILKFKEHNESKGQVKLTVPIILAVASVLLMSIPRALSTGIHTLGIDPPDTIPTYISPEPKSISPKELKF